MVEWNAQQAELYKQIGYYRLTVKKQMRSQKLTKTMIKQNVSLVEAPTVRVGLFGKKELVMAEIQAELKATQGKIE